PHALHAAWDQTLEALAHLTGGLVGEGHRQDARGVHALVHHQVGDTVRDDARLAAARAGEDHQRALCVQHGLALRWVHALEVDHDASSRSYPRTWSASAGELAAWKAPRSSSIMASAAR